MLLGKLKNTGLRWLWLAIAVIAIDQYSKWWVTTHLAYLQPVYVLPVFNLTLAHNTGAAFSFLHAQSGWQNVFLGSLAAVISIGILIWLSRLPHKARLVPIALCLILGGALGNAWDRINYQFVVDFLSFHWGDWYFAIFNLADSAISVGAGLLFLHWAFEKNTD